MAPATRNDPSGRKTPAAKRGVFVAESFFSTIKTELLHRQPWPTHQAARQAIFEYIEGWYNTRRRHSTLGYLSPPPSKPPVRTCYQRSTQPD